CKLVCTILRTLLIGGVAGLVVSFFVIAEAYASVVSPCNLMALIGLVVFFIGLGLVCAVISQTGVFAYLFINRFGLGMFRSDWPMIQGLLIAFVVFDL